jgi:hypothetical protein
MEESPNEKYGIGYHIVSFHIRKQILKGDVKMAKDSRNDSKSARQDKSGNQSSANRDNQSNQNSQSQKKRGSK